VALLCGALPRQRGGNGDLNEAAITAGVPRFQSGKQPTTNQCRPNLRQDRLARQRSLLLPALGALWICDRQNRVSGCRERPSPLYPSSPVPCDYCRGVARRDA